MKPATVSLGLLIALGGCGGNTVPRDTTRTDAATAPSAPLVRTEARQAPGPAVQRYTMSVEQMFQRATPGTHEGEELQPENYRSITPIARWSVVLDGPAVVLTSLTGEPRTLTGKETSSSPTERRFTLDAFAGGYFVMRGKEAQLTIFGSGVHVAGSERGKLVAGDPSHPPPAPQGEGSEGR